MYLFVHMHLFILKNSINWFYNIYNCAFHSCYALSSPKILIYSIIRRICIETIDNPIDKSVETSTANRCIVTLHLANFIVALIQSYWHPIDIYRYLLTNFIALLIQSTDLSKHWHTIDISLLYIWLILSPLFSKHRYLSIHPIDISLPFD